MIDYYTNPNVQPGTDKSIEVHVRPALDSVGAFVDRFRVRMGKILGLPLVVDETAADQMLQQRSQHPYHVQHPDPQDKITSEAEFKFLTSLDSDKVLFRKWRGGVC